MKVKVVKEGEIKDKNGSKLKEFTVTDKGETLIQLTSFQNLIQPVCEKCDYINFTGSHIPKLKIAAKFSYDQYKFVRKCKYLKH